MSYNYTITIKDATTSNRSSPVAGQGAPSSNENGSFNNSNEELKKGIVTGIVAFRKVSPYISQIASNEINKVQLKTGSNRLQEKVNFAYQVGNSVLDLGESVAMGYAVGNVPGAIIGAVVSLSHKMINISSAQNAIDIQRANEQQSREMQYIRAGASNSRSR